ncbi:MAG: putative transporter ATP-binding protein [Chloroflexi bacterium]|nr:putative transporter ATP-binding protein [Chloroflexota bacterium]
MDTWTIEADNLVKKFPHRTAPAEKNANNGQAANIADEHSEQLPAMEPIMIESSQDAPSSRRIWPFKPRKPQGWLTAVAGVSLQIRQGEIFGLLGPNGAGKSTTIRMLCTLLEPTSGTARINGFDIRKQANQVRQSLGIVLGGERSIYWKLTARENLAYFASLYHIPPVQARRRIDELLDRMSLTARADDLVEKFSSGMKQRVAIARALLANPPVILLDEPTIGLDPQAARQVRDLVKELQSEGHTILLTTHYMEEADQLSNRIGIIDQGRIIALDTPTALKERIRSEDIVHLEISGWRPELEKTLKRIPSVDGLAVRYTGRDSVWDVSLQTANSRAVLPVILDSLSHNGTHLVNMNIEKPSLEDVFINLTGKALRD